MSKPKNLWITATPYYDVTLFFVLTESVGRQIYDQKLYIFDIRYQKREEISLTFHFTALLPTFQVE